MQYAGSGIRSAAGRKSAAAGRAAATTPAAPLARRPSAAAAATHTGNSLSSTNDALVNGSTIRRAALPTQLQRRHQTPRSRAAAAPAAAAAAAEAGRDVDDGEAFAVAVAKVMDDTKAQDLVVLDVVSGRSQL